MVNGGLLEQRHNTRRYKYQLLDPVDEPYAMFRFFYRSYGKRCSEWRPLLTLANETRLS